jgi:hypothetical protein
VRLRAHHLEQPVYLAEAEALEFGVVTQLTSPLA